MDSVFFTFKISVNDAAGPHDVVAGYRIPPKYSFDWLLKRSYFPQIRPKEDQIIDWETSFKLNKYHIAGILTIISRWVFYILK